MRDVFALPPVPAVDGEDFFDLSRRRSPRDVDDDVDGACDAGLLRGERYAAHEIFKAKQRIYGAVAMRSGAAEEYEISEQTARSYMRLYRDVNHLPPRKGVQRICGLAKTKSTPVPTGMEDLQSMTKEELIDALVMARITEARLKKGYLVEGVGAHKTFIPIGRKSTK